MQTHLDPGKGPETIPDRRRHPRYRFSMPITIHTPGDQAIPGIGIEISESGLSAITADSLKINATVEIAPIAGGRVLALVRRNIGRVSGFEFLNLTPEQIERIRKSCKVLPLYRGESLGI
jgi:PilZ domain